MEKTIVCYLIKNDKYLMLYRNKKKIDPNKGKWITVGGHIEHGETKEEACVREVFEETGYKLLNYKYLGQVFFMAIFVKVWIFLYLIVLKALCMNVMKVSFHGLLRKKF